MQKVILMRIVSALLIAGLCNSHGAFAQTETGTPEPTTPTEAPTEAPAPTDAAAAPNEEPREKVIAVHGDWQLRCRDGEVDCFMYQLAKDVKGAPVAEVSIQSLKQDDGVVAGITVITPLRSFLPAGLSVQVDNNKVEKFPFLWCAAVGCFVQYGLNSGGLNQYKRGARARVSVVPNESRKSPVTLDLSLTGFTAAFNELAAK